MGQATETGKTTPEGLVGLTHLMYGLHAFSALTGLISTAFVVTAFLTGWPSLLAVIINFAKRDDAQGTWLASHLRWQWRTFWFALLWLALCGLLMLTVVLLPVGWVGLALVGVWVLYRIIRGWLRLAEGRSIAS